MSKLVYRTRIIVLIVLLIISIVFSVSLGSVNIDKVEIVKIIGYKFFGIGDINHIDRSTVDIIWKIRLPRVVLGGLVGMGLSVGGLITQAIVKNPLADPYILGVSSGASLGASLAIVAGVGSLLAYNYIGLSAFLGAFLVSMLVLTMANIRGQADSARLLLSGMAINSLTSALTSFIIYLGDSGDGIRNLTFWLMGSLSNASWSSIKLVLPVVLIVNSFFISQYRILNLMLVGDEAAITLGYRLQTYRIAYLVLVSLEIGVVVFSSGVIGFVGLIIPHITRILFGISHEKTILASSLLGGIFLIIMDLLSRTLLGAGEIPIGILVSLIGSPVFIYLMLNRSYGFGGGN